MFEFLGNLFKKESRAGYSIYQANNQAQWSKRDYQPFSVEGYQKNVIAYQAINKVAKAISQIPWAIKTPEGEQVVDTPLAKAIAQANVMQSRKEWLEQSIGFYLLSGDLYWEKAQSGAVIEFYALRPDRMSVKLGDMGVAKKYTYKISNDKNPITWDVDEITGDSLIRHIKTFNPLDDVYGMSPIQAAAYSIDQHNEASAYMQALLQNGAAPSGALVSDAELSEEAFNRLKAELDEKYQGSANAGRAMLLENGVKWQSIGMSPQNMSVIETKQISARDIALAIGVPPLLLSIQGDSTYSNYKEARLAFYEETVIPMAEMLVDEFNSWNKELLNGNYVCLELDAIPAIIDKRMMAWEMADKSNDLTINERRAIKGYEEINGGDELYIESNKIPISFDQQSFSEDSAESAIKAGLVAYGEDLDNKEVI